MYVGGRRTAVESQPRLQVDQLGDTVSSSRRLDSLDPAARYLLQDGLLLRKVEGRCRGLLGAGEVGHPGRREMDLTAKVETYTRAFWKKLNLDAEGKGDEINSEMQHPSRRRLRRGHVRCPGLRRVVREWLKKMNRDSSPQAVGAEEDLCREDHSEGEVSFSQDREPPRTLDPRRALRHALAKTLGKAGREDPRAVLRLYLARYLHSDVERDRERPLPAKSFAKTATTFLKTLREGNANVRTSKKDFVTIYQGVKTPEEILRLEQEQQPKTELRTVNLQECIQLWTAPPSYRSVSNGKSLIDSPDDTSSVELEDEDALRRQEELFLKKRYMKSLLSAVKWPKKYRDQVKELDYLQNLDVSLKGREVVLLCIQGGLHLLGKLSAENIEALIESAEKHAAGDRDLKVPHRKLIYETVPLIQELCEKREWMEGRGEGEDWLVGLLEEADPFEEDQRPTAQATEEREEGTSSTEGRANKAEEMMSSTEDEIAHFSSDSFTTFGQKATANKFSVARVRAYYYMRKKKKLVKNIVKYNKKFNLLINDKKQKVYTLPRFYKFGKLQKYSNEELEGFLQSQKPIDKKCDYIIQFGSYVLKGQEKVMKKCLLSFRILGTKNKYLKLALLLYSMLLLKDELEACTEESDLKEKFKMLNELRMAFKQLNNLEVNIAGCANLSRESWQTNDNDYQMKTFVPRNEIKKINYKSSVNPQLKVNGGEQNKTDSLDYYRHYNYKTDINFEQWNDYSSEEGDVNENHYLDNLCSCGVVKEESGVQNHPLRHTNNHVQIEYHQRAESSEADSESIKITSFKKKRTKGKRHRPAPPIAMLSRESMLNLHSVFDHGLDNYNRDQVLKVVKFVKALGEGKKMELVFAQPKKEYPETFQRATPNKTYSKYEKTLKSNSQIKADKNPNDAIEKYLHTELYPQEAISEEDILLASDQVLPTKYLERVFHHVQQLSP